MALKNVLVLDSNAQGMHNFKKGMNSLFELSVMLLSMVPYAGPKVSSAGKVNALDMQWSLHKAACF